MNLKQKFDPKILVCGQDETNKVVFRVLLERHGFAAAGCSAEQLPDRLKAEKPDVLLIDVAQDEDFVSAVSTAIAQHTSTAILTFSVGAEMSAISDIAQRLRTMENFSKPFRIEKIVRTLRLACANTSRPN